MDHLGNQKVVCWLAFGSCWMFFLYFLNFPFILQKIIKLSLNFRNIPLNFSNSPFNLYNSLLNFIISPDLYEGPHSMLLPPPKFKRNPQTEKPGKLV